MTALAIVSGPTAKAAPQPDRLQAVLATLDADLLGHDSATAVLQRWCDAYGSGGLKIVAQRVKDADKPLPPAARAVLGPDADQGVRYRRVRLSCGEWVLSEADNWYLPARLTPVMNQTLDGSDTPFGVVVRPLDFHRRHLTAKRLYAPASALDPATPVLRHTAVLITADGAPFSYVIETYTGQALTMALRP